MRKLPPAFYQQSCLDLSQALLGKYLVHVVDGQRLICRITETEAYLGVTDRASHAYGGRLTDRTRVMYGPAGLAYVYLIYGMYDCLNVVAEAKGNPCAVLIRGGEPVRGQEQMSLLRYHKPWAELTKSQKAHFADGPGKLCRAMGITRAHNGLSLMGSQLFLAAEAQEVSPEFDTTPRINVDYAGEDAARPWRFVIKK